MQLLTTYLTDIGIEKRHNQDSLCLQIANTHLGEIVLGVVCDGMGGLKKGELASASVVLAFSEWFNTELPQLLSRGNIVNDVCYQWSNIIQEQNHRISEYGKNNGVQLGTTLTALLILESGQVIIGHVGDTRVYRMRENIVQMTEDQTLANLEIKRGNLSAEQAEEDSRQNILLQCIGASVIVEPEFVVDVMYENDVYLMCSDGFRHKTSNEELFDTFNYQSIVNKASLDAELENLFSELMYRDERDNITAIVIRT